MTTVKWRKACEIFEQALDHPKPERKAFIQRACQDDDSLYARVKDLLDADSRSNDLFEILLHNIHERNTPNGQEKSGTSKLLILTD